MGIILFTFLTILSFGANASEFLNTRYQLDLNLYTIKESKWKTDDLNSHIQKANNVFAQCGVEINVLNQNTITHSEEIYFDLEGYTNINDPRPQSSALELTKKVSNGGGLNVFFIQRFDSDYETIKATAVPLVRIKQEDQMPALNTVWITRVVDYDLQFSPEEGGDARDYSVLAHELGHILLNDTHIKDYKVHNLMHEASGNLNGRLTLEQCKKLRGSQFVKRFNSEKRKCNQIDNPVAGLISFDGVEPECDRASDMINFLSAVQEELSDLFPAFDIDFYFLRPSITIQYQDRNMFESSLDPSYDYYGSQLLTERQKQAVWIHELGHAMMNAQLKQDWLWWKKRDDLFKSWNKAIRLDDLNLVHQAIEKVETFPLYYKREDIVGPYHELYADSVAVLYFNDPQIIKEALAPPKCIERCDLNAQEIKHLEFRDFSIQIDLDHWNEKGVHAALAPSRYYVWQKIQKMKKTGWTKKQINRYLYKVLSKEIMRFSNLSKSFSTKEMNISLIKKLK